VLLHDRVGGGGIPGTSVISCSILMPRSAPEATQRSFMTEDRLGDILDILKIAMLLGLLGTVLALLFHYGKSWDGGSYLYDGDAFNPIIEYKPPTRTRDETDAAYNYRCNTPEFLTASSLTSRIVVLYSPWCPVSHSIYFFRICFNTLFFFIATD
jgi:hypothetical protein